MLSWRSTHGYKINILASPSVTFILSEDRADLIAAAIQDIHATFPNLDLETVEQIFGETEWISCLTEVVDDYDLTEEESQIINYAISRVSKNADCWEAVQPC